MNTGNPNPRGAKAKYIYWLKAWLAARVYPFAANEDVRFALMAIVLVAILLIISLLPLGCQSAIAMAN